MFKTVFLSDRKWIFFALVFAAVLLFANLGNDGMTAAQEGRTAIIVRNMILSGNCMDMTVKGGIPYEKPIGHYWLCLPFGKLFALEGDPMSRPVEWALRLPSALSAVIMLLAAAWIACRIYDRATAAVSIVVLSSMSLFLHLGRLAHIDMPLASAYTCAMVFLYTGYFHQWRSVWLIYGFYFFLGWGVLLKGPLPLLLAGLTVLAMMVLYRRWKLLCEIRPVTGGLLFLAVALPWYIAESIRTDGAFYREFIINQNIRRFTGIGSTYRNGERMSLFYYIPNLIAKALPWSVPALIAIVLNWKMAIKRPKLKTGTVYLLAWAVTGFLFFSFSALKRGDYLLPVYAPLAVLTARALVNGCRSAGAFPKWWRRVWYVLTGILLAVTGLLGSGIFKKLSSDLHDGKIRIMSLNDAKNVSACLDFAYTHIVLLGLAAVLIAAVLFAIGYSCEKRRYFTALKIMSLIAFAGFTCYYCVAMPKADLCRTVKPLIREARKIIPPGETVVHLDFNTELIFFLNTPFEQEIRPESRFVFCDEKTALELEKKGWTPILRTPADHRYDTVLLKRNVSGKVSEQTRTTL